MMATPHPYQVDYDNAIEEGWTKFSKQLVVSPTGSGKTNMFCWQVERVVKSGGRCLILVDQDELVWQPIRRLREVTGIHADAEKAEFYAPTDAKVVVATVQSLKGRRLERWKPDDFELVICDEADKSITPQWMTAVKYFDGHARTLGFTATPHRTDKKNLGVYYKNVIEKENLVSLIQKGFLSPITIKMLPIKFDLSNVSVKGGDYDENEQDEIITPHLEELARLMQIHAWDRRSIVFLPLIKTCEKFNEIANDIGLNADYVWGTDPDRDTKLKRFKSGQIDILSNSMLLTRGVDVPAVDNIAIFRFTKSITLYFQMAGRGTRLAPGKTDCQLMDCLYQASKRLVCRPAHLIAKSDEEVEMITKICEEGGMPGDVASQLDLLKIAGEASSLREASLKKKLEEHRDKAAKTISAEEFAMKHNSIETAEFAPAMAWESNPVSPKQKKYLTEAGIDIATVSGTAHASRLLDIYFKNKPLKMASMAVRTKMRQLGNVNWATATESEGRQFFASLRNRKTQESFI